jgi:hypothetical protein
LSYNTIKELEIFRCHITNTSINKLAECCPGIKILHITGCDDISLSRTECCPNLKNLDISECSKATDISIIRIAECCAIEDIGILKIAELLISVY